MRGSAAVNKPQHEKRTRQPLVAQASGSVVEIERDDVRLVLHCASPQHANILGQALVEGVAHFEVKSEPRFMVVWEPDKYRHPSEPAPFFTLSQMLDAERESDDEPFKQWLRTAEVGFHYVRGGGAAPLVMTWRV